MPDDTSKRAARSRTAQRFDDFTLAAFFVAFMLLSVAVFLLGVAESEDRIGCRVDDLVNLLLAYPRACH